MSEFNTLSEDINARKIQRKFRKNNILRNTWNLVNLDLIKNGEKIKFDKFTKLMREKNTIDISEKFIKSLSNYRSGFKLNQKVLLTAYLIKFFSEDLLGKDQHPIDKGINDWSEEVFKRIAELNVSKDIDKLWLLLNNYNTIFSQWKENDKSRLIESIIISYYNRSKHIEKINAETNLDPTEKEIALQELKSQRQQIVGNIKFIDPEFDVEYFLENYEEVYNNMNSAYEYMTKQIGNTMKKAYYDMLCQEIGDNNLLPIAELMTEISKRLLVIVPDKKREKFAEKINVNVIVDLITDNQWNDELKEYLNFIAESIFMLGAKCDDEENKKWLNELNNLMIDDYMTNFPLILIQMEEKLDRIYQLINSLSK